MMEQVDKSFADRSVINVKNIILLFHDSVYTSMEKVTEE